ncbi:MAG: Gfo/Idh/MocA family oxidoreductase [Gammaproteobacteria bacterium]|nr:Gfo/Idh/MocA family oxidoreductase [Gammaproteobacteria bacterium]
MSARLRVGVVGVGYLGRLHAKIYASIPDVELIGVADINADTAAEIAAAYQCTAYVDCRELLPRVDAVSIVVPTSVHRQVAEPFLQNGVHMLLEKPVASTVADAQAIVELAERTDTILQIGHLERFNAGVMALAERVGVPRFIEVHRLGTFVERASDVDVVTDLMIHDIDIVLSLVKSPLRYISAVGSSVVTTHIDIANARLEFTNGTVANVTASRVSNKRFRRIRVFSENQYQALNFADQQIDIVRPASPPSDGGFPEIISERVQVEPRPPLDAELEHFSATVRNGAQPLVNGRDGLAALEVAAQVRDKIQSCLN